MQTNQLEFTQSFFASLIASGDACAPVGENMLFMVIEHFKDAPEIYRRFAEKGRMMPEGLRYVSSWIDADFSKCFQLMEADDARLFEEWIANWNDLADFEIIQVMTSKEAAEKIAEKL